MSQYVIPLYSCTSEAEILKHKTLVFCSFFFYLYKCNCLLTSRHDLLPEDIECVTTTVLLFHCHLIPGVKLLIVELETGAKVMHVDITQSLYSLLVLHGWLQTV